MFLSRDKIKEQPDNLYYNLRDFSYLESSFFFV